MAEKKILDGIGYADGEIRSFLMVGQSNMAGRGKIGEVPPIENDDCFMLRNGRFQILREPINPDRAIFGGEFCSGIGLAASFADDTQRKMGYKIGLIPCADGGTMVEQWLPGEVLFDNAVAQTRLAMRSSRFSGILWHQGESDAAEGTDLGGYGEKLRKVLLGFRQQLGDVPVILGEISREITPRWGISAENIDCVNRQIRLVAQSIPMCAAVCCDGLSLQGDGIHFCAASCRVFGSRYSDAFLSIAKDF